MRGGRHARGASHVDAAGAPFSLIEVTDSGAGFLEGDAERIFARIERGPASQGSGLGLTIARAIVEAHHGTLTAHSAGPGRGARFTITIPALSRPGK